MAGGGQTENLPPEKKLPPEIFFAAKVPGKIFYYSKNLNTLKKSFKKLNIIIRLLKNYISTA